MDFTQGPLADALTQVQRGSFVTAHPELSPEQKALVYYYTRNGSATVNQPLYQSGGQATVLSQQLAEAVRLLPKHPGLVYSAAYWEPAELQMLQLQAASGGPPLHLEIKTWPAFLSASQSKTVARQHLNYSPKNCLLYIVSQAGRRVAQLSHYGPNGPDAALDEREVVFLPNTQFRLTAVRHTTSFFEIELLEL